MKLLVPYVSLRPELPAALELEGIDAVYTDTSAPDGYWRTLRDWWAQGETFIVLEQDKIPAPGLLQELWDCGEPWCTTPVPIRHAADLSPYPSLSCTKFDASLMAEHPGLMEDVGLIDYGFGLKEWSRLDLGIAALLGGEAHWHPGGRVEHLHDL